ncbi:MAG: hypothetical protein V2J62_09555 [candidate division KSB1 bacterium]|nr:hypothetical protein [candidate division KSB1 bacterium]
MLKDDYPGKIADAGFQGVEVVEEVVFPLSLLVSDADAPVHTSLQRMGTDKVQKPEETI